MTNVLEHRILPNAAQTEKVFGTFIVSLALDQDDRFQQNTRIVIGEDGAFRFQDVELFRDPAADEFIEGRFQNGDRDRFLSAQVELIDDSRFLIGAVFRFSPQKGSDEDPTAVFVADDEQDPPIQDSTRLWLATYGVVSKFVGSPRRSRHELAKREGFRQMDHQPRR